MEETGTSHPGRRAAWVADLKWTIRMRAQETELAQAARESEGTGRISRRSTDVRTPVLPFLLVFYLLSLYARYEAELEQLTTSHAC